MVPHSKFVTDNIHRIDLDIFYFILLHHGIMIFA